MIVKIIRQGRGATLVEWEANSRIKRGWIPDDKIDANNDVSLRILREAAPYGVPFEKIVTLLTLSPEDLADALRRKHVWTEQDLIKNPQAVSTAIVAAAGISVSRLQSLVRNFEQKQEVT